MSIPPLHTHTSVPAMGAVSKSPAKQVNDALAGSNARRTMVDSPNSDNARSASPFSNGEVRIAYRVKRSNKTEINGWPNAELWNGNTLVATVNAGKSEDKRWLDLIEKSLYKAVMGLHPGEPMDLLPTLKVS